MYGECTSFIIKFYPLFLIIFYLLPMIYTGIEIMQYLTSSKVEELLFRRKHIESIICETTDEEDFLNHQKELFNKDLESLKDKSKLLFFFSNESKMLLYNIAGFRI